MCDIYISKVYKRTDVKMMSIHLQKLIIGRIQRKEGSK